MQRRPLIQALLAAASQGLPGLCRGSEAQGSALQALADQAWASGALPGFQMAVLARRRLVWSTAQGLANASTGQAATDTTGYYIASTTKCFTALAAAQLAARGELDLRATLAQRLPQVAWRPSLQAEHISVRELLTHTHGLAADSVPAQLRINLSGVYRDNTELLAWLAQATPARDGKAFAYSNLGYDLAAMLMAPAGRDGWKALVQREVLELLALKRTSPWRSTLDEQTLAAPHADSPLGWQALPANKLDSNMGPAGGMFATAGDLAQLLQVLLDDGRLNERRVLTRDVLDPMVTQQVEQNRQVLGYQRFGHSLGFDMARWHGRDILTRMGSFRGASSHLSFMPAEGLGVVFLTNGDAVAGMAGEHLVQSIYRCLLGDAPGARQMLLEGLTAVVKVQAQQRAAPPPPPASEWPLPPEALVGHYRDEQLGDLSLHWNGQALRARWGVLESDMSLRFAERRQWRVDWTGQGILVEVLADAKGRVTALRMYGRSLNRQPEPTGDASDPASGRANAGTPG